MDSATAVFPPGEPSHELDFASALQAAEAIRARSVDLRHHPVTRASLAGETQRRCNM